MIGNLTHLTATGFENPLTLRRLLQVYLPLAVSWMMMAAESPICTGFVNRLPDQRVQLAALLILFGTSLFIESPVIDLLATSTTLARNRQNYGAIRRFALWMMALAGGVHVLVAATPLFDVVFKGLLLQSDDVANALRLPMLIMIPWSPAIGWRRHMQGLLIRNGITKPIGIGTSLRVSSVLTIATLLFLTHRLPGAVVAACAMASSVSIEAVYMHYVVHRVLPDIRWSEEPHANLGQRDLARFHFPLTASTMVMLTAGPLTGRALAQSPHSLLALDSWQVASTLIFLLRTVTFALPEVVIANWREGQGARLLSRFCIGVGLSMSLLIVVMWLTSLDKTFFERATLATPDVAGMARQAFLLCALLPLVNAGTSYVKGILTAHHVTVSRLAGTGGSVLTLLAVLSLGVSLRWPGVNTAAIGVTLSQLMEFLVLATLWRAWVSRKLKTGIV